ncbi:HD domain-containing protein [Patescibacteria group bacterium]
MDKTLRDKLIVLTRKRLQENDPSHDIGHVLRVLAIAEKIALREKADLDIVVPAAIFHDIICYPKNHKKRLDSSKESAAYAKKVLRQLKEYRQRKIKKTCEAIECCSFSKNQKPATLEAKVLHDADSLEAVGAIAIMRTFSSSGNMNRPFYNEADPFCENRSPDDSKYAVDLFYTRLLVIKDRLYTLTAKNMVKQRHQFLKDFLVELKYELAENQNE